MLFGKLPACGDFVVRGLSPERHSQWDRWATEDLAAARENLGSEYEAAHDAAAPLAFRFDDTGVGVVAPSIDTVGRRFVLMAGLTGADVAHAEHIAAAVDAAIRTDLDPEAVVALLEAEPVADGDSIQLGVAGGLVPGLLLNHLTAVAAEIAS